MRQDFTLKVRIVNVMISLSMFPDNEKAFSSLTCYVHLFALLAFVRSHQYTDFNQNCVMESFDIIETYGNEIVTYGLSKARIITLIEECLSCNIFK